MPSPSLVCECLGRERMHSMQASSNGSPFVRSTFSYHLGHLGKTSKKESMSGSSAAMLEQALSSRAPGQDLAAKGILPTGTHLMA
jgi:hypothetical protein